MFSKTEKQFFFEVQLNWLENNMGVLHARDVCGTVHVATPSKLGGDGKEWSPEHLFLSSISSSYMTTYLAFAKKIDFEIIHFECNTIGQIEIVDEKYKFTRINIYPKIYITDKSLSEKAKLAIQKTQESCLVCNSVNAAIFYHSEILTIPRPFYEIK